MIECLGPCRFGGWDESGEPIAVPHPAPWIQIAATNIDQTRNTSALLPGLVGSKDRARELGLDIGKEITYGPGSARIESVTSSPRALEGSRPSLVIMGETHHWLSGNEGMRMAQAIQRNLAKSRDGQSRSLAITNAHEPGEESVAEADWEAWQQISAGKSRATGLMYDSLEAPVGTKLGDVDSLRRGLLAARGDSRWLDVERLIEEVMDPTTPPSMSMRFYLNQIVAADDAFLTPQQWGECAVDDRLAAGDVVTLAFDGSLSSDHTALVACRVEDGLLQPLGHWRPEDEPDGRIDNDKVHAEVVRAFQMYDVVAFYADVRFFESYVDRWRDEFREQLLVTATLSGAGKKSHAVAWDFRTRFAEFTAAVGKFEALVLSGDVRHTGDEMLAQHVANAKRAPNRYGFSLRKESRDSSRKIDLCVTAVLASLARWDVQAVGVKRKRTTGSIFAF